VIHINLLPHEYRKAEATPIGRFLAIVIGAVLVTSGLVAYGYVHYSELKGVREVRASVEEQYANKKAQAQISQNLQAEINAYETRRQAISQVARSRILQSRKLDEFLDIVHNGGNRDAYYVWLDRLSVTPARRARRRGKGPGSGGTWAFDGYAETTEFSRVTNLRDAIRKDSFFEDFQQISMPNFKAQVWDDGLEPSSAGKFSYQMTLKPLGWRHGKGQANNGETNKK
jgi:Tfp pilus assembly protein PilN